MHSSKKMFQHLFTKGNFQTNAGHGKKNLKKKSKHEETEADYLCNAQINICLRNDGVRRKVYYAQWSLCNCIVSSYPLDIYRIVRIVCLLVHLIF